jgi:hypothetical protein
LRTQKDRRAELAAMFATQLKRVAMTLSKAIGPNSHINKIDRLLRDK